MRWCRFRLGNNVSYGIVEGADVLPVSGSPFGRYRRIDKRLPLSSVNLLVPVVPSTFYAAGANYIAHAQAVVAEGAKWSPGISKQ